MTMTPISKSDKTAINIESHDNRVTTTIQCDNVYQIAELLGTLQNSVLDVGYFTVFELLTITWKAIKAHMTMRIGNILGI